VKKPYVPPTPAEKGELLAWFDEATDQYFDYLDQLAWEPNSSVDVKAAKRMLRRITQIILKA
jgi:hypothetical protein